MSRDSVELRHTFSGSVPQRASDRPLQCGKLTSLALVDRKQVIDAKGYFRFILACGRPLESVRADRLARGRALEENRLISPASHAVDPELSGRNDKANGI